MRTYLKLCLPAYKKTEQAFWALSCMPLTGKNTWPRYCCLNVNGMEVLVAGVEKQTKQLFSFVVIAKGLFTGSDKRRI
ncbi:hypothetical protein GCM10023186_22020 [Hymenobacter koreensis]|uniref:Uncharacterized protein n=1 Tax=Hymenobacter koreensis TaxID=1084523 RepID=A0ABP8IZH8_9BACT